MHVAHLNLDIFIYHNVNVVVENKYNHYIIILDLNNK
jgi:hypothetical protein